METTMKTELTTYFGTETLEEAINRMIEGGYTRVLSDEVDANEHYSEFLRSIRKGETPTIGQTLAAYYVVQIGLLEEEMYADDSEMTNRQYGQRMRRIKEVVFQKKTKR